MCEVCGNPNHTPENPGLMNVLPGPASDVELLVQRLRNEFGWSTFAVSLCDQFARKGTLSDKQVFAARRMIWNREERQTQRAALTERIGPVQYPKIKAMFASAFASRLKNPRLRFETDCGQPIELTAAKPGSKNPGCIYVTDGGPYGANRYFGKIDPSGTFTPGRDCSEAIVAVLNGIETDPLAAATAFGRKTGRCCFCGKHLTAEKSVDRGYGPICAEKYGLA